MSEISNKIINLKLTKTNEKDFFKIFYSLNSENPEEKSLRDIMIVEMYDFFKNMFIDEFKKSYTISYNIRDYESNFKIFFLESLKTFDLNKGVKFGTYLFGQIKKVIQITNKEESLYAIKEYRLNILNIFKSKILEEFNKNNNQDDLENVLGDYIISNKSINLRKIYNDIYKTYSLPKIKFESIIKDLPYVFSQKIKEGGNGYDDNKNKIDNLYYQSNIIYYNYNENNSLDIYFLIDEIYKKNKNTINIFIELVKKKFKVECSDEEIKKFYNKIKEGGEIMIHFLDKNINIPEDFIKDLAKKENILYGN